MSVQPFSMSGFNFARLGSLVQSVQSTIKTVESSIDRAMGTDEQSLAAHAAAANTASSALSTPQHHSQQHANSDGTPPAPTTSSSTSAYPTPSRSGVDVNRFVADTTGDFFSSFGGDGFAPPVVTPSKRSTASSSSSPTAAATTPSSSGSWDLHSLTSAARSILPSTPTALTTPRTDSNINLPVAQATSTKSTPTRPLSPITMQPLREEEKKEKGAEMAEVEEDEEHEQDGWGHSDIDLPVEVQPMEETKQEADRRDGAGGKEKEEVKDRREEERDADKAEGGGSGEQPNWSLARTVSSRALAANSLASFFPSKEERDEADRDEQDMEEQRSEEQTQLPKQAEQQQQLEQQQAAEPVALQTIETKEQISTAHHTHNTTADIAHSDPQTDTSTTDSAAAPEQTKTLPPAVAQPSSSTASSHASSSSSSSSSTPSSSAAASPQIQPTSNDAAQSIPSITSNQQTSLPPSTPLTAAHSLPSIPSNEAPPTAMPATPSAVSSSSSSGPSPSPAVSSASNPPNQANNSTSSSQSTSTSTSMEELLKRCETAELISSKLNRLVKIRELQLEKLQLEHSATTNSHNQTLSKLHDKERELDKQQTALLDERRKNDMLRDERDTLRRVRDAGEASVEVLKAKDAQIEAVMKEGQQLMQKQSSLEQIIRKLRKEVADKDKQTDDDRKSNERLQANIDKLREELKEEKEKREKAEESVTVLTHSIDEVGGKYNELLANQHALETHTTEYALELERVKDERRVKEKEVESLRGELQALVEVKREKDAVLESMKHSHLTSSQREESLLRSVHELQLAAKREEEARVVREESLQYELRMVRDQLREAEKRNEELAGAVPAATRPLLRQIDSLRSMMAEQGEVAAKLESELRGRVKELEKEVARERRDRHSMDEAKHRMEMEVNEREQTIRQLKERLTVAETASRQAKKAHEQLQTDLSAAEERAEQMAVDVQTATREKEEVEAKWKRAVEEKRAAELKQQAASSAEKEARQRLEAHIEQSKTSINGSSAAASSTPSMHGESPSYATPSPTSSSRFIFPASPASSSAYLQLTSSSSDRSALTATSELLRSLLRQKEGELLSVREQLYAANRQRDDLSERLIADEAELARLKRRGELLDEREKDLAVMRVRYDAALQLIGEKEDELEELHSDMAQVKQLFRQQIEHLMQARGQHQQREQELGEGKAQANGNSSM